MNSQLFRRLLGVGLVVFALPTLSEDSHHQASGLSPVSNNHEASAETFKYVCPMHPQIVRDHEGTCPICGMDLVKQKFEQDMSDPKISASTSTSGLKQGFAIRTVRVQKTTLWKYIPTFGRVMVDESKVVHIHPRASGWIKELAVRSDGESIDKGQLLYKLYAPEIVSAQQDLLLARQNRKHMGKQADSIVESARVRLKLLGLDDPTIRKIEQRNQPVNYVPIYAPQSGVISDLTVQNGMYIQPQSELMSVTDLSTIWVEAEVLPLQQNWIREGLTANITTDAYPGQRWESQIDYLYPLADEKTQAIKVRLPVLNPDQKLKPNMLMDIEIFGGPKRDVLAIPMEAIIDDGLRKRVVKQLPDGRFQVVEVVTGMETQGVVEILAGLSEGSSIVVSGQFLIDSESQIQSNLKRLMSGQKPSPAHSTTDNH